MRVIENASALAFYFAVITVTRYYERHHSYYCHHYYFHVKTILISHQGCLASYRLGRSFKDELCISGFNDVRY